MLTLFVGYRVRTLRAAVIAVAVVLASTATVAQRRQPTPTTNTEEVDRTQAMARDTRDAYVKYF
jgi:hypothetical protein